MEQGELKRPREHSGEYSWWDFLPRKQAHSPLETRRPGTEGDTSLLTAGAKWTVVPKRSVALVCGRLLGTQPWLPA